MGFGRLASLYYFEDRASAALRGALETTFGFTVPVVGVRTDPAGCFPSRQMYLLKELDRIESALGHVDAFHLVGHSTGGVDAELLTCSKPLNGTDWSEFPQQRRRIASVTTIAAPHYGTCLVESSAAGWLARPNNLRGAREALGLCGALVKLFLTRSLAIEGLEAALLAAPESLSLVWRFLTHRQLIEELRPTRMRQLRESNPPDPEVPASVRCFVTTTPAIPIVDCVPRACDGFFDHMHGLAAECALRRPLEEAGVFVDALNAWKGLTIAHPEAILAAFGPSSNDGVVNSARQLLDTHAPPGRVADALGGIVIGDHGDVLGHYDRQDWLTDGTVLNQGFFRSGSGFGDDQFFALWDSVAEHIASRIRCRLAAPHRQNSAVVREGSV